MICSKRSSSKICGRSPAISWRTAPRPFNTAVLHPKCFRTSSPRRQSGFVAAILHTIPCTSAALISRAACARDLPNARLQTTLLDRAQFRGCRAKTLAEGSIEIGKVGEAGRMRDVADFARHGARIAEQLAREQETLLQHEFGEGGAGLLEQALRLA